MSLSVVQSSRSSYDIDAAMEKISALEGELARLKAQIALYALTEADVEEEDMEAEEGSVVPPPPPPPLPPPPPPATPAAKQVCT